MLIVEVGINLKEAKAILIDHHVTAVKELAYYYRNGQKVEARESRQREVARR